MVAATEPDHGRSVLLLYGTETGTSQDFAEEISRCLERLHFDTDVAGLDDVNYALLKNYTFTVFVLSTTGQGDFPENARKFWTSLLRKKLPPTTLAGSKYALVGLGDSSYPKFNWAARKLDKRLRQLGATSILESCEADEQGDEGTDGYFLAWLDIFRKTVLTLFPLPEGLNPIPNEVLLPSKYRLEGTLTSHESQIAPNGLLHTAPKTDVSSESFPVVLEKNERVTPAEHWQDVRFMRLKTVGKKLDYMPGDALAILPQNMPTDVSFLIDRMNWHDAADIPVRLVSTRPNGRLPHHPISTRTDLTLRILLTEYLDINAIPRRSFFGAIANYTDNEMHKERLLEFTDPQYLDEYYDYATRPRRSMLEILQEFDSVHIPWEEVTNIFPPLRARQFSIASGGVLKHGDGDGDNSTVFELLVAIVKYRTVIKRIREGVCTRYLAQLPVGTTLQVSLKTEGRFSKSSDPSGENHILVGAGTGIAPLRALIHEKARGDSGSLGRTALFFGCRSEKADYFFHDEWVALNANANITPTDSNNNAEERFETDDGTSRIPAAKLDLQVIPAFSRDQKSKVYVQDRIRQHSDLIWELLRDRNATVIVCGSSGAMPKAVRQAIVDALVEQGRKRLEETGKGTQAAGGGPVGQHEQDNDEEEEDSITSEKDAEMYLARLEKVGRYKQETWS
ncbi:NADPH-dependent diflavin oxidoreductase 1 [Exophiala dermatitidis]|uniref:NADPH-dependent diflavin oxidoreductase 1 n=1 Tax=Exophiala dermatitidis (strain ATCC 34100 / CBS 525.76 / NIH/UT8656) TaxID=858893 RepID=H6BZ33_EXODN|nr:NADPH-ferrihemoprotein reductase [Exophiala dermatitidis NIH/UT8656]EHY56896.1 NADPH-ferrihemoprotein reductase [Exophiala dermatitidis NIH/UT8656]